MAFEVNPDAEHPAIQNDGMQYEGLRFRAECRLAGKLYGQPFGVDAAFGDPILGDPETVTADDVLAFAGIAPPMLRLYPIETHIAEKLHAYTMPRTRPNTRVKDLPDMALLATTEPLEAARLRAALERTFAFRATHPLPSSLPNPPANWLTPYVEMARENELACHAGRGSPPHQSGRKCRNRQRDRNRPTVDNSLQSCRMPRRRPSVTAWVRP
jgi:Nucleotidyl transferase AbiEii toxin, Type IV TA system